MNVSVVMSTYNRCKLLGQAIEALLAQETGGLTYEVIIVDNNSKDETRKVIESYAQQDTRLKYVFEPKQGVAYGRNSGIAITQGEFIFFCDDDVVVSPTWVKDMYTAMLAYPDADFVGGRVLPLWKNTPPAWINIWMSPLALQNYGDEPIRVSKEHPVCLISACLGVRRRAFDRAGLFDPATQRVGNSIGSSEDHDWETKIWDNGGHGMYVPAVVCHAEIPPERQKRSYHRRWHLGHGKFTAIARQPEYEGGRWCVMDVSGFVYRGFLQASKRWFVCMCQGRTRDAFHRENEAQFYLGFIMQKWKQQLTGTAKRNFIAIGRQKVTGGYPAADPARARQH